MPLARPEVLAIIPARGGSKGIPKKNLRLLKGEPLVAYSINHALMAHEISRVVVSTDDPEIGDLAVARGAEVIFRPAEISGDSATSESALLHVLESLSRENYEPELIVFLQPTSPIRQSQQLDEAISQLRADNADSLFSAARLNWFVWRIENGVPAPLNYDPQNRPMRQTAPLDVVETGSFYVLKPWVLRQFHSRLGGRIAHYVTGFIESFQIDEIKDLELVEHFVHAHHGLNALASLRLLVLDFDGVLTNNYVWVDQNGTESVRCTRADSLGINRLQGAGVEVVVFSTETNPVVQARCRKLGIECISGCNDKSAALDRLMNTRQLHSFEVGYLGNDLNDLECLNRVGVPISVADGTVDVRAAAKLITQARGGEGAVREVCEWVIEAKASQSTAKIRTATTV